ncbi:hypothetical protein Tsubulata_047900 [Turnera subulata]|uniref:HMG box domain-containing protein n=1 Tax=Turnera subulata TaxID=218843 RepID=A0A9Q0J7R5_9ROSI|nr:hypothetical protein Tsubulata_047900 [Turnera subulata]
MAKRPQKSKSSRSSAASSASANTAKTASNQKLVLKIKSNETKRMSTRQGERTKAATKQKLKPKPKKKVDAKMPKKPPTAFFFFLEDFRKEFQEQNPDVKSMRDVGKACGDKWKTMTYEEKVKYYDIATEKRAEFDRAMAEYIKRKESGEDEEIDEGDSEYED